MVQGISTKSESTTRAALGVFVISAIGACIAYYTGEPAAEKVESLAGISRSAIEAHEEFAEIALVGMIILGVCSLIGLFLSFKKSSYIRLASFVLLLISLISFGLVARTGYLGGEIRHSDASNLQGFKSNSLDSLQEVQATKAVEEDKD